MAIADRVVRWGGARLSRRISRSVPVVGALIAGATIVATMRKKGMLGGAVDTGLNAIPFLGAAKNVYEVMRGRDIIPDRRTAPSITAAARTSP